MSALMRYLQTDFTAIFGDPTAKQHEAENGLFAEDANVVAEDQPLPDSGLWCDEIPVANYFADVPFPNPVSQEDHE